MRLLVGFTCIVMAVGCSDDSKVRHLPDAPPPPDADVDASTFGPVSLTILEGTTPQVGVLVIFQNADSTVVSETTTGTDGKASAMMMPGGYVTAIDPFPNRPQGVATSDLRTFAGVKPGDQLRLFESPIASTSITVNVVLPIENNSTEYRVSTNCSLYNAISTGGSGGQPMGSLQLFGCGPTSNLLVEALDANLAPVSSIYKQNVALTDNGTIDLTADTYTAIPDVTFTYTNVPAGQSSIFVNGVRVTSLGKIYELNGTATVDAGNASFTTKVPTISNATAVTATTFVGNIFTQHLVTEWGPAGSSYALDATGLLLPNFESAPALDIPTHSVTWTAGGGTSQSDFVLVTAFLNRSTPLQSWRWTIAAPGGTQAALPVLPASSTFNPIAGDFAGLDVRTGKVPGGYDAVRANVLAVPALQEIAIGASGKASFTFFVEVGAIKPPGPTSALPGFTRRTR
jgi:hypothetical protein